MPLEPVVVRLLRAFADSAFQMQALSELATTVGVKSPNSYPGLTCFDLPGGAALQLAAGDDQGVRVGAAIVPFMRVGCRVDGGACH